MDPRSRKILGVAGATALLAMAVVVGSNEWTKHALNAAHARCRAAGLPMTLEQIRPPRVSEPDNAHSLIVQIGTILKSEAFVGRHQENGVMERFDEFQKQHPVYRLSPAAADELAHLLDAPATRDVLTLLRAAGDKPGYNAHLQYERGFALLLPEVGTLRTSARLLSWQARLYASRGEADAAFSCLWTMMHCADFLADEPTLISQLTRVACIGIALDALQNVAATAPLPPAWAARFCSRTAKLDFTTGFLHALDAERVVVALTVFDEILKGNLSLQRLLADVGFSSDGNAVSGLRYVPRGLIRLEYAEYLNRMQRVRLAVADTARGAAAQSQQLRAIGESIPRYHPLVRIIVPTVATVAEKFGGTRARVTVATTGLALAHYHAKAQRYPDDLTALVPAFLPEVPRDHFTGKPLRYMRTPAGAVVYSVGPNRLDDGGVSTAAAGKDDIAWHAGFIPEKPISSAPL